MPGAGRLGDKAQVQGAGDAHGCPACPHPGIGPAISGSPTVFINGRPALRVDDVGIQAACCGANFWTAKQGAPTVSINGKAAFRMDDMGQSCGGTNKLIEGSDNVIIGQATSAGSSSSGDNSGTESESTSSGTTSTNGAQQSSTQSNSSTGTAAQSSVAANPAGSSAASEAQSTADEHKSWIEVVLTDEEGKPKAGYEYKLELPDFSTIEGNLDGQGQVRRDQIASGLARIWIPDEDEPVDTRQSRSGKAPDETAWLEVEIKDDNGNPMANLAVKLELPDGTMLDEKLDANGRLRKEGIKPGEAKIHLPDPDADEAPKRRVAEAAAEADDKGFVDLQITDDAGKPMAGLPVRLRLADGTVIEAKLDEHGRIRKEDVPSGDFLLFLPEEN